MKINMKAAVYYFLIGIGFGSIIYSLTLILNNAGHQAAWQIGAVVLVSGCMGLISMIFTLDHPAFVWRLAVHFLAVYTLYLFANHIGGNREDFLSLATLVQFLGVYVLVWAVVVFMTRQKVAKINEKLRERKHSLSIENENVPQN